MMSKLKTPLSKAGLSKLMQCKHFSNDVQNKNQNTRIKSEIKQNEIVTEKFRKELLYIKERNKTPIKFNPLGKPHTSSTEGTESEESYSCTLPMTPDIPAIPVEVSLERSLSEEDNHIKFRKVSNSSMTISDLTKSSPIKANMTPVLLERACDQIISETNQTSTQVDLSTALVPLSLHVMDKNLLVDSIVQDVHKINEMYCKASERICHECLVMQNHSNLWYIELDKFFKQPDTPQNFVREQVMSQLSAVKDKIQPALLLCQAKEPSAEKKTEKTAVPAAESPFDKIKKIVENLISVGKVKLGEMKKKAEESKKKETKKEV